MREFVIGIKDVQKLLKQVSGASHKAVAKASRKGANIALAHARAHCYDGLSLKYSTGRIKKSLKLKSEKGRKGKKIFKIGPASGTGGWRAVFIDYGFTDRNGVFHPGNRFLRNSIDLNRDKIEKTILKELYEELKKLK